MTTPVADGPAGPADPSPTSAPSDGPPGDGAQSSGGQSPEPRRRAGWWLAIAAAVFAVAAAAIWLLPSVIGPPHLYSGTVLQGAEAAPSLSALRYADDGSQVDLAADAGDVVLIYFGFTNCPDVCPTTLSTVGRALETVDDPGRVDVLMVSVDPARDDPATLEEYVRFFGPTFRGATGAEEEVALAASAYGVFYELGVPDQDGAYNIDHTASLMAIGPDGVLRIVWPTSVTDNQLAADIDALLS
ncbi:MAG: SCO family protein [Acidimicrobiales bacterium]